MKGLNKENGITLVALIVTIIVLLILSGVAITKLVGSGLLQRAKIVKQNVEVSQKEEDVELNNYENKIGEYLEGARDNGSYSMIPCPDYENGEEIKFVNNSYTVEKDGYIQVSFIYTSSVDMNTGTAEGLDINNVRVFAESATVYWHNVISPIYPVRKGDNLYCFGKAQEIIGTYYPSR